MNVQETVRQQLGFWHGALGGIMGDCGEALNKQMPNATITSIGSIYAHMVFAEDAIVNRMLQDKDSIFQSDGWQQKTGVRWPSEPGGRPEMSPDWAKSLKMDLPKFQEYANAVFANTDAYLANVSDADLGKKVQTPIGEQTAAWMVANVLATHAPQHAGEIAALKGVQGLKGLPF